VTLNRIPLLALPVVSLVVLAGCTQTVDPSAAANVIRSQIGKFGPITASAVSCPSGVKKKDGTTLHCRVTLGNTSTGAQANGTITLHITDGGARAEFTRSDIHFD